MFLIFILALYSIVNIITTQFIFKPFRELVRKRFSEDGYLYKLITCPTCLSFWASLPLSIFFNIDIPLLLIPFVGSGAISLIHLFAPDKFKIKDY
jgi:hypothetical protein